MPSRRFAPKRQLVGRPDYIPKFRNFPLQRDSLVIELESVAIDQLQKLHEGFARTSIYDALRRIFMMWFLALTEADRWEPGFRREDETDQTDHSLPEPPGDCFQISNGTVTAELVPRVTARSLLNRVKCG